MPARPILILTHDTRQRPALLGDLIARAGLSSIALHVGGIADLPDPRLLENCSGLVVLDRPTANDPACAGASSRLVAAWHAQGRPLLGLGGGARLVTHALGGQVAPAPSPVRGWFRIGLHPQAACAPWLEMLGAEIPTVLQWHIDEFRPPPGASMLLRGAPAGCQGWKDGATMALNPLLHVDAALYADWLAAWQARPGTPSASWQTPAELAAGSAARLAAQRVLGTRLLGAWLAGEPSGTPVRPVPG